MNQRPTMPLRTAAASLLLALVLPACAAAGARAASAAQVTVAVAANFAEAFESLASGFEEETGHRVRTVIGATGTLYAQVVNGAPYDVLLAADRRRPRLLAEGGHGLPATRFTYALGRLALWSADPDLLDRDGARVLREGDFRRLAIANPDLAPYGEAARQVLRALGAWERLRSRIVLGENVGKAFTVVATGNAELGLVALSHVLSPRNRAAGSRWEVPASLYDPIRQDAVVLRHGADNPGAHELVGYLRGPRARAVMERFGYARP